LTRSSSLAIGSSVSENASNRKLSDNPGFWRTFFGDFNFVTVIAMPVGEDTRLMILADAKGRRADELIEQVSNFIGREVALEEA